MAEQKKKGKKTPEQEKAVDQVEAPPEEEVTAETVEKAEETGTGSTVEEEVQQTEEEPKEVPEEVEAEPEAGERKLEKPLEKMTAKELRAVAVGIPEISGAHAMKKEELLVAIRKAWGITPEKAPKKEGKAKAAVSVADLKTKIREIKAKRAEAIERKDKRMAGIYRRMINRLKKRTRRAA